MPEPLAHVYDLALRALDEQERQVVELRSRLAPVVAACGIVATLLSRPAWRNAHRVHALQVASVSVGFVGIGMTTFMAAYLLLSRPLSFGVDASVAWRCAGGDADAYYVSMIGMLDARRLENLPAIRKLHVAFTAMLYGMLVGVCGLVGAIAIA
jgi:hypothetical protein